jgi:replicative DNA helicase
MAQLTIDVAQNLYDTTKTTTTQQLQQAEQDIANLQQQLHQTENDLQILITTSIEEVPTIIELEGDL